MIKSLWIILWLSHSDLQRASCIKDHQHGFTLRTSANISSCSAYKINAYISFTEVNRNETHRFF